MASFAQADGTIDQGIESTENAQNIDVYARLNDNTRATDKNTFDIQQLKRDVQRLEDAISDIKMTLNRPTEMGGISHASVDDWMNTFPM